MRKKTTEVKCYSHHIVSRVNAWYHVSLLTLFIWMRKWCRGLCLQSYSFFPSSAYCILQKLFPAAHTSGIGSNIPPQEYSISINYLEFFCLAPYPPCMYSFIYTNRDSWIFYTLGYSLIVLYFVAAIFSASATGSSLSCHLCTSDISPLLWGFLKNTLPL